MSGTRGGSEVNFDNPLNKCLLLVSVFITDEGFGTNYRLPKGFDGNKIDQFISSLASMAKILTREQWFFIDYSENHVKYSSEISDFIMLNYNNPRIFPFRLEYYQDWKKYSDMIPQEIKYILLQGNADHVYLPHTSLNLDNLIEVMDLIGDRSMAEITHWPESIYYANRLTINSFDIRNHKIIDSTEAPLGTTLLSAKLFTDFWTHDFTENSRIVRLDNPFGPSVTVKDATRVIPPFEMFRHLDGYGHVGIKLQGSSFLRPSHKLQNSKIIESPWKSANLCEWEYDSDFLRYSNNAEVKRLKEISTYLIHGTSFRLNWRLVKNLITNSRANYFIISMSLFTFFTSSYFWRKVPQLLFEELLIRPLSALSKLLDKIFSKKSFKIIQNLDIVFLIFVRHDTRYLLTLLEQKIKFQSKN